MFQIERTFWGNWEVLTLSDSSNNKMTLAPGRGACLLDLQFEGQSIIEGYSNAAELESLAWGRSALLFPFPNRLEDGRYSWKGKTYQFPINEAANNNALHGFGMSSRFGVEQIELGLNQAKIQFGFAHKPRPYYPFSFKVTVSYQLNSNGIFRMDFSVENRSKESIPFAFGWHPYFRLNNDGVGAWALKLPVKEKLVLSDRMLPTGQRVPFNDFQTFTQIGANNLDDCFVLDGNTISLRNSKHLLEISHPSPKGKFSEYPFPYFQVFTPPARTSIALEPMSSNINSFTTKEGLWEIAPGAMNSFSTMLKISRSEP